MAESSQDTFPRLLLHHARARPQRPAIREKDLGIWQTWTWAQVLDKVRALACGLAAQGFRRGDHLAVIGANRPRLYWSMMAAQCLGGVPVPLYEDAIAAETAFVLGHADVRYAVAEDQEQCDKLLEALPQCPRLERIYYDDPRGLRHYRQPQLASVDTLEAAGREHARRDPGLFEREIGKGAPEDVATILYTSGTTGHPKGVILTHAAMIATGRAYAQFEKLTADEEMLAYLPLAWVGQNLFSYSQSMVAGFCVSCPESAETVMTDLREIGPTYYFAPPRVLEALLTQVTIRMEDAAPLKRALYRRFMETARRVGAKITDRRRVGLLERLVYALGDVLVY